MKRSGLLYSVFGVVLLMIIAVTPGCGGGGGGGGGGAVSGQTSLSGTVASGAALAGVTVTLKDSLGSSVTATTAGNGTYSIDTTGLVSPFLVLVNTSTGTKFYSVTANNDAATTVNVTPLTDLVVRTWYNVQGVSVDTAFAAPVTYPPPSPTTVAVICTVVQNVVQLWLNEAGVPVASFNLISTPFAANGTGIDAVLDKTTVNPTTGQVTIASGGVTQNTTVTAASGSMTVVTSTTGTSGDSSSTNSTVIPVLSAQQAALDGITATVNSLAATVNARGTALTGADLLPYFDPATLLDGLTQAQAAAQIAFFFKGSTISFSNIVIKALPTSTTAQAAFKLSQTLGGQTNTENIELFFSKPGSSWLLSGNNQITEVEVRTAMVRSQGSGTGTFLTVEVNINAPRSSPTITSLSGAVITGGPWSTATALSYSGKNAAPWDTSIMHDSYSIYAMDPVGITGGQLFTVSVTPTGGSTVTYTKKLNAITTEPIQITNLTGGTIADATLGVQKTVNWTLPKTFAISQIRLGTVALTGPMNNPSSIKCDDAGSQVVLGITATTAQVTIPTTCSGQPTVEAEIYLQVYGINGELTQVYYTYQ